MLKLKLVENNQLQLEKSVVENILDTNLIQIIKLLEDNNFEVRIIGGAVRDILLGQIPRDVDLATTCLPEEMVFLLSESEIEADVWGLKHGTVKAVFGDVKYEITSLNYQITKTDGKINIKSNGTWEDDANRRDFTVNAMSMTLDGKVYDYLNGVSDLKNQIVRPIPDFETKISKDPAVEIRLFKMLAKFPNPKVPKEAMEVAKRNIDAIKKLSKKRQLLELDNIKKSINAEKTLKLMDKIGLLQIIEQQ